MIYLDSSVVLARLFAEDRVPRDSLWRAHLISSRLLEYEVWNRVHAHGLGRSHSAEARAVLDEIALLKLSPEILERALQPFPVAVRTLDGLHLATIAYLRERGQTVELASYDARLNAGARGLEIPLFGL